MVAMMAMSSVLVIPICVLFFGYIILKDKKYTDEQVKLIQMQDKGQIDMGEYLKRKEALDAKYNK